MDNIKISVVVPVYNEASVFGAFHKRLKGMLEGVTKDFEILYVDDGSTDATPDLIRAEAAADPRSKYISFSRNFGHQVAVSAGLEFVRGDAVIVLDGDLQDPPEVVLRMIEKWRGGVTSSTESAKPARKAFFSRHVTFFFTGCCRAWPTSRFPRIRAIFV